MCTALARRLVEERYDHTFDGAVIQDLKLVVSELVDNAYVHGEGRIRVRLERREDTVLIEVIDGCLGDPDHQYRAPDGSTVVLLNPEETSYTLLRSTDGILLLPRYRLQHYEPEHQQNGANELTPVDRLNKPVGRD